MRYRIGGLIFGGAYTWRGLFSEFYGNKVLFLFMIMPISIQSSIELSASIKQPLARTRRETVKINGGSNVCI